MPVKCFEDNGVMVIRVDAGDGLRARPAGRSPFSHQRSAPTCVRMEDVGDCPQTRGASRAAMPEPLTDSDHDETASPYVSTSSSWSLSTRTSGAEFAGRPAPSGLPARSFRPPPGLTREGVAPPPGCMPIAADKSEALPLPPAFYANSSPAPRPKMTRGRQQQAKRVLAKLQERARTQPHLPVTIPPCMADYMSEEKIFGLLADIERIRTESLAATCA